MAEGTLSKVTKVKRACELLNNLYSLQIDIQKLCGVVCQEALQGDGGSLQKAVDKLADRVGEVLIDKYLVHHNLFITLLLGSIAKTMLVKQPCYIQTKMYRLY